MLRFNVPKDLEEKTALIKRYFPEAYFKENTFYLNSSTTLVESGFYGVNVETYKELIEGYIKIKSSEEPDFRYQCKIRNKNHSRHLQLYLTAYEDNTVIIVKYKENSLSYYDDKTNIQYRSNKESLVKIDLESNYYFNAFEDLRIS